MMTRSAIEPGDIVPERTLTDVTGVPVRIPEPGRLTHLQLRRFAGCPVCNLHLRSVVGRLAEIEAADVREVVVFHSTEDELRPHAADLRRQAAIPRGGTAGHRGAEAGPPLAVVADPGKRLYAEFGVEPSRRAMLDPRAWAPILRGVLLSLRGLLRRRHPSPSLFPEGGRYGLPGDFLIADDGRVIACKYGEHAYDQWSVDELLTLARKEAQ